MRENIPSQVKSHQSIAKSDYYALLYEHLTVCPQINLRDLFFFVYLVKSLQTQLKAQPPTMKTESVATKKMSFSQADLTAIAPMLTPLQPYLTSSSRNTQILANLMLSDPLFVRLNMSHINLQHGTVT